MLETSAESPAPVRVVSEALKGYVERLGPIWIEGEISEINERTGMAFIRLRDTSVDMSLSVMCHRTVLAPVSSVPPNARVVMLAKVSFYTKMARSGFRSERSDRSESANCLLASSTSNNSLPLKGYSHSM